MNRLKSLKLLNRDIYFWLPLLLMLAGLAVRAAGLGAVPGGVNQDEAMAAYDAYSLSLYGADRLGMRMPVYFQAWGYAQMGALMSYLMIPFIRLLGFGTVVIRLPTLLISAAGLWVTYLFVRDMLRREAGWAALFIAAINPWHIMQSRWALEANMFPHFLLFAVYALYRSVYRNGAGPKISVTVNLRPKCLSMFLFAMCMYTYGIAFYTVPLMLLVLAAVLLVKKQISRAELLVCAAVYLLFAWPVFAVMAINYFRLPSLETPFFTAAFFPAGQRMSDLLPFSQNVAAQFGSNLISLVNTVFLQKNDLPWNTIPRFGPLYIISVPFAAIGAFWLLRRKSGKSHFLFVWLGAAVFSGLITNNVNVNRINIVFYPLIILCGIGLYALAAKIGAILASGLVAAYVLLFAMFVQAYFGSYAGEIKRYFYADFLDCLSCAEQRDPDVYYISAATQSVSSPYVSEILALYALKTDPAYFRGDRPPNPAEHGLAYEARFSYPAFSRVSAIPLAEAGLTSLYVVNIAEEMGRFPAGDYGEIYRSGRFCVLERISGGG